MLHQEAMYQLRCQRNRALIMEAQQDRITQAFVRNQRLLRSSTSAATGMKLVFRYAGYILSTLRSSGSVSR